MYRAVVVAIVVAGAARAARAGDKPGCKDPAWAPQRLPAFELTDCEHKVWATLPGDGASGQGELAGELTTVTYTLVHDDQDPGAKKPRDYYAAAATKAGGKLVSDPSSVWTATFDKTSGKDHVIYRYEHGSGNEQSTGSYTLTTLRVAAMPQLVVAKVPAAAIDTQARCSDPPWLRTAFPGYKPPRCEPRDFDQITFETESGDKTIAGRVLAHTYELDSGADDPVPQLVQRNYIAALEKIGAKRVSKRDDANHAVLTLKAPHGELWFVYTHEGGNERSTTSYSLVTVEIGAPPPKQCKLEIYGLHFDTDKATLRPDADPVLAQLLALFKSDAKLAGELSGHTDDVGDKSYNVKLSQQRADAVKAWLVAHGIDGARITTRGYGDSKPLVPNDSEDHRAKNRRVELARTGCK